MRDGEIIIKLKNVWKIYQMGEVTVEALRGLELEIKKGEFVSVMGPSGSGKSTCVNMIGCLDIPTKGNIFLEHKDISHMTESELAQIRGKLIGFVFQAFNLIPTSIAKAFESVKHRKADVALANGKSAHLINFPNNPSIKTVYDEISNIESRVYQLHAKHSP